MGAVAGVYLEVAGLQLKLLVADGQGQATFEHIQLFAPAFGVRLRLVDLAGLQPPLPQLRLASGRGAAQQHRLAAGVDTGPDQLVDATGVAVVRRLDQVSERHVQCFGHSVQGGQADVVFPGLDGHQHAPADPGFLRQGILAQFSRMPQPADVVADMLQYRRALAGIFVHYIAH
ncbi:hypothetical protein D9M71_383890 [compost metagenome]